MIQSPFQTARALAIVEEPEGRFRYDWVDIANGFGRYAFEVRKEEMPKLAVHFMIMRGRLPGGGADPTAPFDQGKPVTIAATKWVTVTPVKNIVTAKLEYPEKARPGQTVEVTLHLSDDAGQTAFRRGNLLDGRSGRLVARKRAAARSAAGLHRKQAHGNDGARHAQSGLWNYPARRDARRRRRQGRMERR